MLRIFRSKGETINIEWSDGRRATVEIEHVKHGRSVSVLVYAPDDVLVLRGELDKP